MVSVPPVLVIEYLFTVSAKLIPHRSSLDAIVCAGHRDALIQNSIK